MTDKTESPLDLQLRLRKERHDRVRARADARKAVDLAAFADIEEAHGASCVSVLWAPFLRDDLPMAIVVGAPTPVQMKRYRDRLRAKDPDTVMAATELAGCCRLYPDEDAYKAQCEAFTGIAVQAGMVASDLAHGREDGLGKA